MILSLSNRGRILAAVIGKIVKDMIRELRQKGNILHEIRKQSIEGEVKDDK